MIGDGIGAFWMQTIAEVLVADVLFGLVHSFTVVRGTRYRRLLGMSAAHMLCSIFSAMVELHCSLSASC